VLNLHCDGKLLRFEISREQLAGVIRDGIGKIV
jgi:hypothetical protein